MCMKIPSSNLLDSWVKSVPSISAVPSKNSAGDAAIIQSMGLSLASILGCVCLRYGFILCGEKHIRLLGGKNDVCCSMLEINGMDRGYSAIKNVLIVADTSEGGIFAVNCSGKTGADIGEILYLPANSITWERLDIGYADFAKWAIMATEADLVSGRWIENPAQIFSMQRADAVLKGKIGVLKSFGETGGE